MKSLNKKIMESIRIGVRRTMEERVDEMIKRAKSGEFRSGVILKKMWKKEEEFQVGTAEFNEFTKSYCSLIHSTLQDRLNNYYTDNCTRINEDFNPKLYGTPFAEIVKDNKVPIIINMKLEFSNGEFFELISPRFILSCVSLIQSCISDHFIISVNRQEQVCFWLQSDLWVENNKKCLNIRFHFPYTFVDIDFLNNVFIKNLSAAILIHNIPKMATETLLNTSDFIKPLAKIITTYGSKEKEDQCPLVFRQIFRPIEWNLIPQDNTMTDIFTISFMDNNITPYFSTLIRRGILDPSIFEEVDKESEPFFWFPVILSIYFYDTLTPVINGITNTRIATPLVAQEFNIYQDYTPQNILKQLLPLISKSRLIKKQYWLDVGKVIKKYYCGTVAGCTLWEDITTDLALKACCRQCYFYEMPQLYYDLRVIKQYASEDSPEEYQKWFEGYVEADLFYSVEGNDTQVANFVHKVLDLTYLYDTEGKVYYKHHNNHLIMDKENLQFKLEFRDKIIPYYVKYENKLRDEERNSKDPAARKLAKTRLEMLNVLLRKLLDDTFRTKVANAAKGLFSDSNFSRYKEDNFDTMSWPNGVTECLDDNLFDEYIIFRKGKIQDYITKVTATDFPCDLDENHPHVKFTNEYYSKVFTDGVIRVFYFIIVASLLQGGNYDKFWFNLIGRANASKTQAMKYLKALGDYYYNLPNDNVCVTRNTSNGHNPAVEAARGARVVTFSESSSSLPLDGTKVKAISGNDDQYNRTHYATGSVKPYSFKPFHSSNFIAEIVDVDDAFRERELIIPFESIFSYNAPRDPDEQFRQRHFMLDATFVKKIDNNLAGQIYIMFNYFAVYKKEGIKNKVPKYIMKITREHQQKKDYFYQFVDQKILFVFKDQHEQIKDVSECVDYTQLYALFSMWFQSTCKGMRVPSQEVFFDEMCKGHKLGPCDDPVNKRWFGVKLKDNNAQNHGGYGSVQNRGGLSLQNQGVQPTQFIKTNREHKQSLGTQVYHSYQFAAYDNQQVQQMPTIPQMQQMPNIPQMQQQMQPMTPVQQVNNGFGFNQQNQYNTMQVQQPPMTPQQQNMLYQYMANQQYNLMTPNHQNQYNNMTQMQQIQYGQSVYMQHTPNHQNMYYQQYQNGNQQQYPNQQSASQIFI